MRLEELKLRVGGDELRVGFHDRLTVVGGVGPADRDGFVDLVVNALAGTGDEPTELTVVNSTGGVMTITHDGHGNVTRTRQDGEVASDPLEQFGIDASALRVLCHLRPEDVELVSAAVGRDLPPEVAEAHRALAALDEEIAAVEGRRAATSAIDEQLAAIEDQLGRAHERGAFERYRALRANIDRLHDESEALAGGDSAAAEDQALVDASRDIRALARRWRKIAGRLEKARTEFGDRARLDAETLQRALTAPGEVPPQLDSLIRRVEAAEHERDRVAARLSLLAVDCLPAPSNPAVVRLARCDQDTVWSTCHSAAHAYAVLEQASVELGGLHTAGVEPAIIGEIEAAHDGVDEAGSSVAAKKLIGLAGSIGLLAAAVGAALMAPPLGAIPAAGAIAVAVWAIVLPRRRLAQAVGRERAVLEQAGVSSYLAFHIRRVDATIDPERRERVAETMREQRQAIAMWTALAGDVSPSEAVALEEEVRAYANSLKGLEGGAAEVDALQHQLTSVAEPELERARAELLEACVPFAVDDPVTAAETVRRLASLSETARLQATLEELEEDEATLRTKLEAGLEAAGFEGGDCAASLAAFDSASAAAENRVRARAESRPAEVVTAELNRLEEEASRQARPEWDERLADDTNEIDDVGPGHEALLLARRAELQQARRIAEREVPNLERLHDRRDALARRVDVLESQAGIVTTPVTRADIEPQLVARLASCRRGGGRDETIFVIMDEPFANVSAADKWLLLDMVERESANVQAIYLTDDADVIVWARRRAGVGALTLLEPIAEPA